MQEEAGCSWLKFVITSYSIHYTKLYDHLKDKTARTVVFTGKEVEAEDNLEYVVLDYARNIVPQILNWLYEQNLQSVVVEGGRQLLQAFIDQGMWDEAHVYIGHSWFGSGVAAPKLNALPVKNELLHDTQLQVFVHSDKD